jgi:arabinan endo-1,5-alpha-L-arabinosidase
MANYSIFVKTLIFSTISALTLWSCGDKSTTPDPTPITPVDTSNRSVSIAPTNFAGPTYSDNYTGIASWDQRSQWNLANVHDPSVEKSGDYYYMYQTDASYGNAHDGHGHYPYRRSKDLVTWEYMGAAFTDAPAWVKDSLNNKRARIGLPAIANPSYGFWAPHIKKVGNKYRMYYAIVVTNTIVGTDPNTSWTERAFIGLAESDDLATNKWTDKGMVVCSEPDGVTSYNRKGANDWSAYYKFNAIDPSFIITPTGEHYLIYGSWHTGIAALKLNPATGKPDKLSTIDDYGVRIAGRGNIATNRWQALEAPEIVYNENTGYYYLFVAYDGLDIPYNTRVSRSKSITGPFVGIDGGNVTTGAESFPTVTHPYAFKSSNGWVGISHCSVFQNPDTKEWFYASQGRLPANVAGINASNAVMMGHVHKMYWTADGWPVLDPQRYAAVPQETVPESYFTGTWEMITLNYEYGVQQTPNLVSLTSTKIVKGSTGNTIGTWSFDKATNTLTILNDKFIVAKSWDWEATPRKVTLTLTGINSSGRAVWAKRQ